MGYSMSRELSENLAEGGQSEHKFDQLTDDQKSRVREIERHYRNAIDLNPWQAWMRFDLAAELARWSKDKSEAVEQLEHAVGLNPSVKFYIKGEEYFASILSIGRVKKLLPPDSDTPT